MKKIYTTYVVYNTDTPDPTFEIQEAYTDAENATSAMAQLMFDEGEGPKLIDEMVERFNQDSWVEIYNGFSTTYGIDSNTLYE